MRVEVELFFKCISATEIEDGDGNHFSNFDDDFGSHRLRGTEKLNSQELTVFVRENLKVLWDGWLDNPDHFKSYKIKKLEGPTFVNYDLGLNLSDLSILLDVEITKDDPEDVDFDDLFHAVVFQLSDGYMTFTMTEFESYCANVMVE